MKHLILSIVISLFFASVAYATDDVVVEDVRLKANDDGQVIVDDLSPDSNVYMLSNAAVDEEYSLQTLPAVSLVPYDYTEGYFDDPANAGKFTITNSSIIDNDLETGVANQNVTITLTEKVNIEAFFMGAILATSIEFYNDDELVYEEAKQSIAAPSYKTIDIPSVNKIILVAHPDRQRAKEFELFLAKEIEYIAVSNLAINTTDRTARVTYKNPESEYFVRNDLLVNGETVVTDANESTLIDKLEIETNYDLIVRSYYADGKYIDVNTSFNTKKDMKPPANVSDLTVTQKNNTAILKWENPIDADFSHVRIFRNGVQLINNITDTTYTDDTINSNTNYNYRVVAVDESGNQSFGVTATIMIVGKNVYNVRAQAKSYDKVDISWKNPSREDFEIVTIYRKEKSIGIMAHVMSLISNDDDYTQLFQTNGTIFNDMTVAADTSYTYKLTSTLSDEETAGVTVDVKTPKVAVEGGGTHVDDTHYTITWDNPTSGQMKILVGGKEYAVVLAANKEIKIPKADMVLNVLGSPDVKLVPIGDDGKEGTPSKPGGNNSLGNIVGGANVSEVLNANNLLTGGVQLLGVVGAFILLGLAFFLTPKLIEVIKTAYHARRRA